MAVEPKSYGQGERAPDGSGWELFGEFYPTNPRYLIGPEEWAMVRLWQAWRGGGMGSPGHLPEPGGILDQAAKMLDAFAVMNAAAAEIEKR